MRPTPFSLRLLACLRLALCVCALAVIPTVRATGVEGKGAAKTYDVVSGDTLDKVIRATMPDSPLKIEILRSAFIQQNPQAFTKTPPRTLMAGSVLTIPDHENLVAMYLKPGKNAPKGGATAAAATTLGSGNANPNDQNMNERKNWVRFP